MVWTRAASSHQLGRRFKSEKLNEFGDMPSGIYDNWISEYDLDSKFLFIRIIMKIPLIWAINKSTLDHYKSTAGSLVLGFFIEKNSIVKYHISLCLEVLFDFLFTDLDLEMPFGYENKMVNLGKLKMKAKKYKEKNSHILTDKDLAKTFKELKTYIGHLNL